MCCIDMTWGEISDKKLRFLQSVIFNVKRSVYKDAQIGTSCRNYMLLLLLSKRLTESRSVLDSLDNNASRLLNDDEVFQQEGG